MQNKKYIVFLAAAAAAAAMALSGCGRNSQNSNIQPQTAAPTATAAPTETPVPTSTPTPLPTSTPKPLPTATPTPVPAKESESEPETQTLAGDGEDTPQGQTAKVVFIGDSRFRALAPLDQSNKDLWKCSSTADYAYLTQEAFPMATEYIGKGTKIFINIGLNDLFQSANYVTAINEQAKAWGEKGADTYFVSVGPVAAASTIRNTDICDYNTYMYQNLQIPFIDMYNYLVQNGFDCTDTENYTDATNTVIFSYLSQFAAEAS